MAIRIKSEVLKYEVSCVRDIIDGIGPSKQGNERECVTDVE